MPQKVVLRCRYHKDLGCLSVDWLPGRYDKRPCQLDKMRPQAQSGPILAANHHGNDSLTCHTSKAGRVVLVGTMPNYKQAGMVFPIANASAMRKFSTIFTSHSINVSRRV